MIQIPGSELQAYRADPTGTFAAAPKGALVVIHEIWGLADHIKHVADRLAAEGYLVVAPDILSNAGVTPEVGKELHDLAMSLDEAKRTEAQPLMREKLTAAQDPAYGEWAVGQLGKVIDYLEMQPGIDGRVGVIGFCFGGSYTFALAAADQRVKAAAPFYGSPPVESDIASIACPVHAFYGDQDKRLMDGLPSVKSAMTQSGVDFEATVYGGAQHAFFNDTNAITFDQHAAADAWRRILRFLGTSLGVQTASSTP